MGFLPAGAHKALYDAVPPRLPGADEQVVDAQGSQNARQQAGQAGAGIEPQAVVIGLEDDRQAVLAGHGQEALHHLRFAQLLHRQLAQEIAAVQVDPVQGSPGGAVGELRLLDVGGPEQIAGQIVNLAHRPGPGRRLRRLQFWMASQHPPHAALTDPRQPWGIFLPAPPQLPGDLSSSPDRVCLLKLTDGLLDLGRRPPRTVLWTGRTVPQVGQIVWPLLPGKRPAHPASRSLQSVGDLNLPQALLA